MINANAPVVVVELGVNPLTLGRNLEAEISFLTLSGIEKCYVLIVNQASLPEIGDPEVLYVTDDTEMLFRWDDATQVYVGVGGSFDPSQFAPALTADENYVTDAEKTILANTFGTNTGDQDLSGKVDKVTGSSLVTDSEIAKIHEINSDAETLTTLAALVESSGAITTPADADKIPLRDSVSGLLAHVSWVNIKAALKTYFDTLYATAASLTAKLDKTGGAATNLQEACQTTITTAVTEIDWSLGHVDVNYAGNTNLTGGFTNIPVNTRSFLTLTLWHNGGIRTLGLLASQLESVAPTLAGTSGGFDRLVLTPSKINADKYFVVVVESK